MTTLQENTSLTNDLTVNTILAVGDPLVVATGVNVALDETAGLQNAATSAPAEDANDNDILLTALPSAF
ncbi:hypothetical protein HUS91_30715, partial [Pseudomonas chlororaphis]